MIIIKITPADRHLSDTQAVLVDGLEAHDEFVGLGLFEAAETLEALLEFVIAVEDYYERREVAFAEGHPTDAR